MNDVINKPLLEVKNLKKYFDIKGKGYLHAIDGVDLEIYPGKTLGLVGESGCGKSTVGNVIMKLLEPTEGSIAFDGEDVVGATGDRLMEYRKNVQIIFQDPYSSLNPRKTVRSILSESYIIHGMKKGPELDEKIRDLIAECGIEEYVLDLYPHELDGGRRQLCGIARALSLDPRFIVCDEPVSALDVSIQATIINLLMDLQERKGLSYLFISHDLSVVRHISDEIAVMYLGQIAEKADKRTMFAHPMHPYSIALLSAVPKVDFKNKSKRIVLTGDVPSPIDPPKGCRFAKRCWMAQERCHEECPSLRKVGEGHLVACHYAESSRERLQEYMQKAESEDI